MDHSSHQMHPPIGGSPPAPPVSGTASVQLPILGMHCAACVATVEGALKAAPGVQSCSVNFATNTANVSYDPAATTPSKLAAAVDQTGYHALAPSQHGGHDAHALHAAYSEHEQRTLGVKLLVGLVLGLPLMVLGMAHLLPGHMDERMAFPGMNEFQLIATSIVVFVCGASFHAGLLRSITKLRGDMDALVSLGTLAAFFYSAAVVLFPQWFIGAGHLPALYFEVASTVTVLVLLGRWLEARARGKAGQAIKRLLGLQAKTANVLRDGRETELLLTEMLLGDVVIVRPGDKLPVDGEVLDGSSSVDESMLSGESLPVDKQAASLVYAGTLNGSGSFKYRATRLAGETLLAGIIKLVESAQASKAPIQRQADQIAAVFVPIVLVIAAVTFGAWFAFGPNVADSAQRLADALIPAVAVLVIACPCALGLATPVAVLVAGGRGAELGVLLRSGSAIETAARVDTVVFDKTGTLTSGKLKLMQVRPLGGVSESEVLALTAAAELGSEHPLAAAVVGAARERGIEVTEPAAFEAYPGLGVIASLEGRVISAGNRRFVEQQRIRISAAEQLALDAAVAEIAGAGQTVMYVLRDDQPIGLLGLADSVRPGSREAVAALQAMGVSVLLLSGDRREVANAVALELGIATSTAQLDATVFAEVLPADKEAVIRKLQAAGRRVAMVGDGVNDAPALAAADIGIAMGAGTDVAIEASDITLVKSEPRDVAVALKLARRTMLVIRQNLFFAFIYNILGIPLAAGVFFPFTGWLLSPVVAGLAMSLSSLSVVTNSLRLRKA